MQLPRPLPYLFFGDDDAKVQHQAQALATPPAEFAAALAADLGRTIVDKWLDEYVAFQQLKPFSFRAESVRPFHGPGQREIEIAIHAWLERELAARSFRRILYSH